MNRGCEVPLDLQILFIVAQSGFDIVATWL